MDQSDLRIGEFEMGMSGNPEKSTDFLLRNLKHANPNVLRIALFQATGDPELAAMRVEKQSFWGGSFEVPVLCTEHVAVVEEKALTFLMKAAEFRPSEPSARDLRAMMDMFMGEPVSDFFYEVGRGSLIREEFPLGVNWTSDVSTERRKSFVVAIVGAGLAGLAAAVQLSHLGIPFIVIERNRGAGGTWWLNDYPEARVDVPSHHYQYSFMKQYPWKHYFATQSELKEYVDEVMRRYQLEKNIRFETELTHATWDEAAARWTLETRNRNGESEMLAVNAVISAAGLFNVPNLPDIPGIESFRGKMFHSSQWDHEYDLTDKRIAQIGVGSTGAQLMPALAKRAAHLVVYQRSPQWVFGVEGYREPVSREVQWLFDNFPNYWSWYSYFTFTALAGDPEGLQDIDCKWQEAGGRISKRNDKLREHYVDYIHSKIGQNAKLLQKLTPDFAPLAKRPVVDNGWFDSLKSENVDLVTESIERITPKGIRTSDGIEREFDLLVLCSGFQVERFLWPTRYIGRQGLLLEQEWEKDGARAHLGVTVPGFPNFFVIYGPNSQARSGGLITWLEIWTRYAVSSIVKLIETGNRAIEVKRAVFEDYNNRMDDAMKRCIWDTTSSYYINSQGRQGVFMPWKPADYYEWIRAPSLEDFDLR